MTLSDRTRSHPLLPLATTVHDNNMNRSHLPVKVLIGSIVSALLCIQPAAAQVVPDDTLLQGERSQVTGDVNAQIDGGARRGGNLFHSFQQFSIPTGGSAYFNNAADVQNIFSRVTGGSASNINGLIRANGAANLFLLNPNGILFGPNASLNIGGSFLATSADAIGFPTGEVFSSDARQPLPSQLLTVNPNALFFNQLTPQPITVQSRFDERVFNESSFNATGLHVPPGQNLLLVGGAIQLDTGEPFTPTSPPRQPILVFYYRGIEYVQPDGGWLVSPGSHVELGAVGGVGRVGLSTASPDWQLTIPNGVPRADVSFSNGSGIDVRGANGSIRLLAQNINITRSLLQIGIPNDSRLPNTQTGDIELNATGSITLSRSRLDNRLFGEGTIGSINLSAGDRVSLVDEASVLNIVQRTGIGNGGDINITTGSLSLTHLAGLGSYTYGRGNAGNVNINARDSVSLDDYSLIQNFVRTTGIGNAGNINITTGSLSLTNDARVFSYTVGLGNAGNVNINARDTVSLTRNTALNSSTGGQGNAGSVNINANNTISLDDSSVNINVFPTGIGNSGEINITTGSLSLINTARLNSRTEGQGNAGSVNINARDSVSLDGSSPIPGTYPSSIYTQVESTAVGQGGNVRISTGSLSLINGGIVTTATVGQGDAGHVNINARDIQISGTAPGYTFSLGEVVNNFSELVPVDLPSGVTTSVRSRGVGNGGDVTITTGSLSVSDFGAINTNAQGRGNAGNIQIRASDAVSFDGGNAISTLDSSAVGSGGNIDITARSLTLLNGAQLSTSTRGQGDAGNVTVNVRDRISLAGSNLTTPSAITTRSEAGATGNGGRIDLTARSVSLTQGGQLATTTASSGRAGNLAITATERVTIAGTNPAVTGRVPASQDQTGTASTSGLYTNTEPNSTGRGGNIRVATGELMVEQGGRVVASTAGQGDAGNIRVRAMEEVTLSGTSLNGFSSGLLTNTEGGATGEGGTIRVTTPGLLVSNGAVLSARSAGSGEGGEIVINADTVSLTRGGQLLTTASSSGDAGDITVNARDRVRIAGSAPTFAARLAQFGRPTVDPTSAASGLFTNTEANARGAGGAIALTADSLSLLRGGRLETSTAGEGDAGNITVNSSNLRLFGAASGLFAQTATVADAGNLTIQPQGNEQNVTVQLQQGAQVSASTANSGRGGRLTITAPESITLTGDGSIISAETSGRGTGGNLTLRAGDLNVQNQAQVTVSSSGNGSAGSLSIDADRIFLDDGRIRADTSGGGGNINLRSPFIVLRNGSNITTNATGSNIPGGNMAIDTQFLVAVPNEDSNISANSEDFRGGNVSIDAVALYGIAPSSTATALNDITATGATDSLSGSIDVTTARIDPTGGLVALPTELVDASDLIARGCPANEGSSFIISGRGGLPPTPEQQLDDDARWQDRRTLTVPEQFYQAAGDSPQDLESTQEDTRPAAQAPIIEATGWHTTAAGKVVLVASAPDPDSPYLSPQFASCSNRR
ncbi:filamentous hemagglutinin N-terminal domain-containing protein [Phormidium tenue FACHB-886]|nr:filamentous hemagglutinin N-terminal domain-containing protein [Phormidium tenue FACHB-886]